MGKKNNRRNTIIINFIGYANLPPFFKTRPVHRGGKDFLVELRKINNLTEATIRIYVYTNLIDLAK